MANTKSTRKISIKKRIRSIVNGDATSPRLSVFRSNKEIYAQLIDDVSKRTIAAASSRVSEIADSKVTKSDKAAMVGKAIAAKHWLLELSRHVLIEMEIYIMDV